MFQSTTPSSQRSPIHSSTTIPLIVGLSIVFILTLTLATASLFLQANTLALLFYGVFVGVAALLAWLVRGTDPGARRSVTVSVLITLALIVALLVANWLSLRGARAAAIGAFLAAIAVSSQYPYRQMPVARRIKRVGIILLLLAAAWLLFLVAFGVLYRGAVL